MNLLGSAVLDDERYRVPPVPLGQTGLAWLRGHVARFSDGAAHVRRRGLIEGLLAELVVEPVVGGDPTATLLRALGLPDTGIADVALVAAAYQPLQRGVGLGRLRQVRLVEACGSRDEATAARICVLVQAHGATQALVAKLRDAEPGPPVPTTRRIAPDGRLVEVDLVDAPFGRGRHACPGRTIGLELARAAIG